MIHLDLTVNCSSCAQHTYPYAFVFATSGNYVIYCYCYPCLRYHHQQSGYLHHGIAFEEYLHDLSLYLSLFHKSSFSYKFHYFPTYEETSSGIKGSPQFSV